jgi:8-oxo-dGTP pyrophosphatase MutT (NUDIX family)
MPNTENPWQIESSALQYSNPWIEVTEHAVINPAGKKGIYGTVHFKNIATGVIVLDEEHHTWLVGQYRFPLQQFSWEIPEGGSPEGTDPLESAKRELQEETGLKATDWQLLLRMHLSNSVSDEEAFVYLAKGLSQHTAAPEETEQLVVKRFSFAEVCAMVDTGEITDSISVAAILKTRLILAEESSKSYF